MGGSKWERFLVNGLRDLGYFAMRAPSSGSATDDDLPDVVAFVDEEAWFIEHKTTSAYSINVGVAEADALLSAAERAGATPYLSAKYKTPGKRTPFYLVKPSDANRTAQGNYTVPESEVRERASLALWTATDAKQGRLEGV